MRQGRDPRGHGVDGDRRGVFETHGFAKARIARAVAGDGQAVEAVFPHTEIQLCLIHLVRHSLNFVSWKQRKAVAGDLRAIYTAATEAEAAVALDGLRRKMRTANTRKSPNPGARTRHASSHSLPMLRRFAASSTPRRKSPWGTLPTRSRALTTACANSSRIAPRSPPRRPRSN